MLLYWAESHLLYEPFRSISAIMNFQFLHNTCNLFIVFLFIVDLVETWSILSLFPKSWTLKTSLDTLTESCASNCLHIWTIVLNVCVICWLSCRKWYQHRISFIQYCVMMVLCKKTLLCATWMFCVSPFPTNIKLLHRWFYYQNRKRTRLGA